MSIQIGIIGGSGLYDMAEVTNRSEVTITTPFGEPSGPYLLGTLRGKRVAFLARHGAGHRLLPSELNFRANIFGMKTLGVERILFGSDWPHGEGLADPLAFTEILTPFDDAQRQRIMRDNAVDLLDRAA